MRIIYIVYREDNTMVFDSQVLEYLKLLQENYEVELILFRNHKTFFKKAEVEERISRYIKNYTTLASIPLFFKIQLDINALRLKFKKLYKYKNDEPLLILCRGELSTYIANKAFKAEKNKVILYDNRGLPIEELEMRNEEGIVYKLNKKAKRKAIEFAKDNCSLYSFVTNNLRNYLINQYKYSPKKNYYIMPTLVKDREIDLCELDKIKLEIQYDENAFYVIYVGSVAAWQSVEQIFDIYNKIKNQINNAKLLILTNGNMSVPSDLSKEVFNSIIIKNVKHSNVKYYLKLSNIGLVLRNDNIVNKVAAPTKIAEYITFDLPILYDGEIGVLDDLKDSYDENGIISVGKPDWIKKVIKLSVKSDSGSVMNTYKSYFDMRKKQNDLIEGIKRDFFNVDK